MYVCMCASSKEYFRSFCDVRYRMVVVVATTTTTQGDDDDDDDDDYGEKSTNVHRPDDKQIYIYELLLKTTKITKLRWHKMYACYAK